MSEPRIVCLVPSITELLFDLGLGDRVVGRTGFCVHPRERVRRVPKVGGTKDLKLGRIAELAPTHVIVNVDENRREDAEALAGIAGEVIVTHPLRPDDNPALYRRLGDAFAVPARAETLCAEYATARAELVERVRTRPAEDVLYLIWRDPWMGVARDTYIAATLALANLHTVPERDGGTHGAARYPVLDPGAFAGRVSRVLLSSEPFHFRAEHLAEVRALVPGARVQRIDGEMTSWYGSRAIRGLRYLAELA